MWFYFPESVWEMIFFIGTVFENHFREEILRFGVLLRFLFFGGVLPMFLITCVVFCSRKRLVKLIFLLGSVFEIHFWERTFVFVV